MIKNWKRYWLTMWYYKIHKYIRISIDTNPIIYIFNIYELESGNKSQHKIFRRIFTSTGHRHWSSLQCVFGFYSPINDTLNLIKARHVIISLNIELRSLKVYFEDKMIS